MDYRWAQGLSESQYFDVTLPLDGVKNLRTSPAFAREAAPPGQQGLRILVRKQIAAEAVSKSPAPACTDWDNFGIRQQRRGSTLELSSYGTFSGPGQLVNILVTVLVPPGVAHQEVRGLYGMVEDPAPMEGWWQTTPTNAAWPTLPLEPDDLKTSLVFEPDVDAQWNTVRKVRYRKKFRPLEWVGQRPPGDDNGSLDHLQIEPDRALTYTEIEALFVAGAPGTDACYAAAKRRFHKAKDEVGIVLQIGQEGKVLASNVAEHSLWYTWPSRPDLDPVRRDFERCVQAEVANWTFPKPSAPCLVTWRLQPSDGEWPP